MDQTKNSIAYLLDLGLYPQHRGFGLLANAVSAIANDLMGYYCHKVDIFDTIERDLGVSRTNASRSMNYALNAAWQSPSSERLHALFPMYQQSYPPCVEEFICRAAVELNIYGGAPTNES